MAEYRTERDSSGIEITPGQPEICQGNGKTTGAGGEILECCCDECDYFLTCYPEYTPRIVQYRGAENNPKSNNIE